MNLPRRRRWADEIREELSRVKLNIHPKKLSVYRLYLIAYHKRLLALLRRVTQCPECRGSCYQISYAPRGKSWHKCPTCNGTGKI